MAQHLYRYAWQHTRLDQIWILCVVLLSTPIQFASLSLPKTIVNGPIQGQGFEEGEHQLQTFLRWTVDLPDWLWGGGTLTLFPGLDLDRVGSLVVLSLLFLAFVLINGGFKYYINTFKGRLGERMLRRLRYEMVDHVLRFPFARFRQIRAPEVSSMVKDELEPIGGFIGDAFVQPVYLLSQALTAMVFIFLQSVTLGMVALVFVMLQVVIIPKMRRRLLVLGRQRQLTARQFAGRVGEVVDGIASIHTNDTSNYERSAIAHQLGTIFLIRFDIYQWKFLVKFLNSIISQITPFTFYLVGGYFAIRGQIDIGQLVAVIAAYKELPSPLKDLIDWDQQRLDVTVKYQQVVEQFVDGGSMDPALQTPLTGPVPRLSGGFELTDVTARDESGGRLVEGVTLRLDRDGRVCATGPIGGGGEHVAEILARLLVPASGRVTLGGEPLANTPEAVTGRRVGYVDASTYFPRTSFGDALLYGLRHVPVRPHQPDDGKRERLARKETAAAGNILLDIRDDWTDYDTLGSAEAAHLGARIEEVLKIAHLDRDVRVFGLRGRLTVDPESETAKAILAARDRFRERLRDEAVEHLVEPFDRSRYLVNASVVENLVFGAPRDPGATLASFASEPYLIATLKRADLHGALLAMGQEIAATMVELFGDLEPGNPLLERMTLLSPDELGDYRRIIMRIPADGTAAVLPAADQEALVRLALNYVEPRHRLGLLDETLTARIVAGRDVFRAELPAALAGALSFYEVGAYNPAASLQDNILFGRIVDDVAYANETVERLLFESLDALGLSAIVRDAGLGYDIGSGGKRLSLAQQQKLALARALMKQPDYLVVNRALAALDGASQRQIVAAVLERSREPGRTFGTFWVLASDREAPLFERSLEFQGGRLAKDEEISEAAGPLAEAVA